MFEVFFWAKPERVAQSFLFLETLRLFARPRSKAAESHKQRLCATSLRLLLRGLGGADIVW